VRFNSIRPGFITTEIMQGVPRDSEVYASYLENTPMNDVGQPEDVAHLARFLIGPESRWITGTAINVDGGHALRRGPNFRQFVEPALGPDVLSGDRPKA
jgi:NAD(P)-dependent dehydrogenase (short-subunit alcohol dehydrogenase family)